MQTVILLTLLSLASSAPPADPIARDTVVICPESFLGALHPWLVHRMAQGHHFAYVSSDQSPAQIRAQVRDVAREGNLRYVVLIGDAGPVDPPGPRIRGHKVPTHYAEAKVNVRFGSEPRIATDNWFADLDDDQVPDVAIGRLTADSAEDLAVMVRKILAYERTAAGGLWRRRVNFVAGVGGFGSLIDSVIEVTAKKFITEYIPAAFRTTMTYGSWRSPYCPDPWQFRLTSLQRINEGCLLWIYMGHGRAHHLDRLRIPGSALPILDCNDVALMQVQQGSPIAIFLSCYTAAFDQAEDCLAEEMLRQEGAPVAILGASRMSMPYGMGVLGIAMAEQLFQQRRQTLGEVILHAKRSMIGEEGKSSGRRVLDAVAKSISPSTIDLAAERIEHVLMYNLLGDPLLRLSYPREVALNVAGRVEAGSTMRVSGASEVDGECIVELVCRRDRLTFRPPIRREFDDSPVGLALLNEIYRKANDGRWATETTQVCGGRFQTDIEVPEESRGACHVRVFVQGERDYAIGTADVYVGRPNRSTTRSGAAATRTSKR